ASTAPKAREIAKSVPGLHLFGVCCRAGYRRRGTAVTANAAQARLHSITPGAPARAARGQSPLRGGRETEESGGTVKSGADGRNSPIPRKRRFYVTDNTDQWSMRSWPESFGASPHPDANAR